MKLSRLKIVTVPFYPHFAHSAQILAPTVPPLSMVTITTALRNAGYAVDQDDLNIKSHRDDFYHKDKLNMELFFDIKRTVNFICGKTDRVLEKTVDAIIAKTKWDNYDAYLFSCNLAYNQTNLTALLCIAYVLRKKYPHQLFIAGGRTTGFITEVLNKNLFKNKIIDFIIDGSGEQSIVDLLNALKEKADLSHIAGLAFSNNSTNKQNPWAYAPIPLKPDFTGLPLDRYTYRCTPQYSKGLLKEEKDILLVPYKFTNGCPFKCAFCTFPHADNFKYKNINTVIEDIKDLKRNCKSNYFYFLEDTFNFSYEYTAALCEKLIQDQVHIRWTCCVHPNNLDEHLLTLMKKAGLKRLIYGFETGSQRLQKHIQKYINLTRLTRTLKYADALGIWNCLEIICGLPHETEKDIHDTITFLKHNKLHIDTYYINHFHMSRHSPYQKNPAAFGLTNIRNPWENISDQIKLHFAIRQFYKPVSFDEVEGMKWEKKEKQINASHDKVKTAIRYKTIGTYENMPYLFYFYEYLADKKLIKHIYNSYAHILIRKALFRRPRFLINELLKIHDLSYGVNRVLCFLGK